MEARIELIKHKLLAGKKLTMSFSDNKTYELWHNFMPQKNKIPDIINNDLYSVEVYEAGHFDAFDPSRSFEKWAAVEVETYDCLPPEFEKLTIDKGLYAVFIHRGNEKQAIDTYHNIFYNWLPQSGYVIDYRPHLAIMGEKYKRDRLDSEEEIWIAVKEK
jgi:AraC family transcriptional regulator